MRMCYFFFFFQAEDGIRDLTVTGVQTCALPIWVPRELGRQPAQADRVHHLVGDDHGAGAPRAEVAGPRPRQNGRGARRGRGEKSVGARSLKKKKKKKQEKLGMTLNTIELRAMRE